jgi:hypothetical protein
MVGLLPRFFSCSNETKQFRSLTLHPSRNAVSAVRDQQWNQTRIVQDLTTLNGGSVMRVSINGGSPTVLRNGGTPADITVDATSVYWLEDAAYIMKLTPK